MLATEERVGRQIGRIVFGSVLIIGALAFVASASGTWSSRIQWAAPSWILIGTWIIAISLGALARRSRPRWGSSTLFVPSWIVPTIGIGLAFPFLLLVPILALMSGWREMEQGLLAACILGGPAIATFALCATLQVRALVGGQKILGRRNILVPTLVIGGMAPIAFLLWEPWFIPVHLAIITMLSWLTIGVWGGAEHAIETERLACRAPVVPFAMVHRIAAG